MFEAVAELMAGEIPGCSVMSWKEECEKVYMSVRISLCDPNGEGRIRGWDLMNVQKTANEATPT